MAKFKTRKITQCIEYDASRLASRKAKCAEFKKSVRRSSKTARRFSKVSGAPLKTVYAWTSPSDNCIPPPGIAERFVWVLNNFPEVGKAIEEEFS